MRTILYVLLAAVGLGGLALLLARRGLRSRPAANPSHEAERLLDRCREMLDGIENAARGFEGSPAC
ncbi:MAG: hypothetical protein GX774_05815 [Armatimonadetes bacterium]|jgi:hypothetical protein|nr:hypothetical protein [Armatimonadota bacterium]